MADKMLLFHSPEQVSEEELALMRSRYSFARMLPVACFAASGAGYFIINNFVLKRYFHWPLIGVFGLVGYTCAGIYLESMYYHKMRSLKNANDFLTIKPSEFDLKYTTDTNLQVIQALNHK